MNKKIFVLFILLSSFILPQSDIFAGSWGETRAGLGLGMPNTVLVFRTGHYDIKGGYDFTEGKQFFFINGSYMAVNSRPFNSIFSGSLGLGVFAKVFFSDNAEDKFMGGMNIPISAEVSFIDNFLQFFATVAPGLDLYPKPTFTTKSLVCWWVGFTIMLD